MTRSAFLLLVLAPTVVGAPVPKDTERKAIEKRYGKIVDPKGDSKFELDGSKLKITLPANEVRTFSYTVDPDDPKNSKKYKKTNETPRVEFTAKGDFVLTVRITAPLDADAEPASGETFPFIGGGVQIIPKNGGWVCDGFTRVKMISKVENLMPFDAPGVWSQRCISGSGIKSKLDSYLLCVTRTGKTAVYQTFADGKEAEATDTFNGFFPDDELTLTLFAQHASSKARTVTFSEFEIKPIEKTK